MAVTRSDAIATTIVVGFTVFLLQVCAMLVHKGIDLKYEWATDGAFYLNLFLVAQVGISVVVAIAWVGFFRNKPRAIKQAPQRALD